MTPSEIKTVLQELGGGANKALGQHFLIDAAALQAMVDHAPCHPGSVVLEVGPGLGVLTKELTAKGCDVIAIERDRRFVQFLDSRLRGNDKGSVNVVQGDAAEIDWMTVVGDREWSLVSNLPYAISSLALRLALYSPRPAEHVVVLLQREVVERALELVNVDEGMARPGKRGSLLALMVALAADAARMVRRVPPGAFFPPPKVDSAILEIEPLPMPERIEKWGIDPEKIMQLAKVGFAHPRKMLMGNLVTGGVAAKERLISVFSTLELSPSIRAEALSPKQWAELTISLN